MARLENLRYKVDNLFAHGTAALLLVLGGTMALFIAILTVVMVSAGISPGPDATLWDIVWTIFTYTFDPSGVPYSDGAWGYRLAMLVASLGGVFTLSLLIGILVNAFSEAVDTLRKGKTVVVENGHTLVLGWNDQVYSIISELVQANANTRGACIVVLGNQDKVEMEDSIRARIPDTGSTRVVCRSGEPIDVSDLRIARPETAKSIIVIDPGTDDADSDDAYTIKILLALQQVVESGNEPTVIATLRKPESIKVAELASKGKAHILPSEVIISQIITQACRQPGLSVVYAELLDFGGDELYVKNEPKAQGISYEDILLHYHTSCVVGIRRPDGTMVLNPPRHTILDQDDAVIALSADDDTVIFAPTACEPERGLLYQQALPSRKTERILVLGWNDRGRFIVRELQAYLAPGSEIVVADSVDRTREIVSLRKAGNEQEITFVHANTVRRDELDELRIELYDSVMILANSSLSVQRADAATIMTLLHVRDIVGNAPVNIVTEMLDERNRSLASANGIDDFIVSNTIVSLLITQIAENLEIHAVFKDLFDSAGNELYLKPIGQYIRMETETLTTTFATLVHAAIQRSETCIGVKILVQGDWVIRMNIPKYERLTLGKDAMLVVIAED